MSWDGMVKYDPGCWLYGGARRCVSTQALFEISIPTSFSSESTESTEST